MSFKLVVVVLLYICYKLLKPGKRLTIPRLGPPTPFGYLWTAARSFVNHEKVIAEGRVKFGGRPFILPTANGGIVIVGPENVQFLQTSNDTIFSQPAAINEVLAMAQTMDEHQLLNAYQATVVRTDLTRAIPDLIPDVLDETIMTVDATLDPKDASDFVTLPVFDTLTSMIGRISNRALIGESLCRNPKYLHAMIHFSEGVALYGIFLRLFPESLRDMLYNFLSSIFGGKKEALEFVVPFLQEYIQNGGKVNDKPHTLIEFLVRAAPPEEIADPARIAMRFMNMNFGSIHTSSIFSTQSLYELAVLPQAQRDEIIHEIKDALYTEGGWNKAALAKFKKLDSVLREVGRFHGLTAVGVTRATIQDGTLPDGTFIPAGNQVSVDLLSIHRNPAVYPNPDVFDPFRFSKMRDEAGSDAKYGFATVDKNFLPFGIGRHACAGRHFAAMQLKILIAYILLNYDFYFPNGVTARPDNITFDTGIIPDPKAKLVFKRRTQVT